MRPRRASKRPAVKAGFKLWLCADNPKEVFGSGKWRLLEAIQREGSLRAAAADLGISYRKAWGDLRKAEESLGVTFLKRRRGGSDGGETLLTDEGKRWLREYGRFHSRVERAVEKAFASWRERIKK